MTAEATQSIAIDQTGAVLNRGISNHPALLLDDGVHPGIEAQKLVVGNAWPTLRPLLLH